jgi:hypothetical protein
MHPCVTASPFLYVVEGAVHDAASPCFTLDGTWDTSADQFRGGINIAHIAHPLPYTTRGCRMPQAACFPHVHGHESPCPQNGARVSTLVRGLTSLDVVGFLCSAESELHAQRCYCGRVVPSWIPCKAIEGSAVRNGGTREDRVFQSLPCVIIIIVTKSPSPS